MSSARELKALEKRLNQLKNSLELRKKKLDEDKKHNDELKKKLAKQKKDLEKEKKEVDKLRRQLMNDQKKAKTPSMPKSPMRGRKKTTNNNNSKELQELKEKLKHFQEESRKYIKLSQAQADRIKVLERKLKNATGKKETKDDKQLRHALRENKQLKKRLRQLLAELNKRRRWYQRVVKQFKNNNRRWVKKQIEAAKKRKVIVKYVFVDDIKKMKVYKTKNGKYKRGIKVRDKNGGEVIIKEVVIEDGKDESVEDIINKRNKKKKNKKKKNKNNNDDGDDDDLDDDDFMDDLFADLHSDTEGTDKGDEEIKTDDEDEEIDLDDAPPSDDDIDNDENMFGGGNKVNNNNVDNEQLDALKAQVQALTDELKKRDNDLNRLRDLMFNVNVTRGPPPDQQQQPENTEETKEPEPEPEQPEETKEPEPEPKKETPKKPKVEKAKDYKPTYKWEFYAPKKDSWIPFEKDVSNKLESTYNAPVKNPKKKPTCQYNIGKQVFTGKPLEDEPIQTNKKNGRDYKIRRVEDPTPVYKWMYFSPNKKKWVPMKEDANNTLENAKKNNDKSCQYQIGKVKYVGYPNKAKPNQKNTKNNERMDIKRVLVSGTDPSEEEDEEEETPEETTETEEPPTDPQPEPQEDPSPETQDDNNNNENQPTSEEQTQPQPVDTNVDDQSDDKFENCVLKVQAYNAIANDLENATGNVPNRQKDLVSSLEDNNYDGDLDDNSNGWGNSYLMLSKAIIGGTQNQERYKAIYEQYVLELNGRIQDVNSIQTIIFYNEDDDNENKITYKDVLETLQTRQNGIKEQLQRVHDTDEQYTNRSEIESYIKALLDNNRSWYENIYQTHLTFNNSVSKKINLLNTINRKYNEITQLVQLVQNLPASKMSLPGEEENNDNEEENNNEENNEEEQDEDNQEENNEEENNEEQNEDENQDENNEEDDEDEF